MGKRRPSTRTSTVALAATTLFAVGCGGAAADSHVGPISSAPKVVSAPTPATPSAYRLLPPRGSSAAARVRVDLDGGRFGVILRERRLLIDSSGAVLRTFDEPQRLSSVQSGVGPDGKAIFLFSAADGLYAADAFDGPLRPIASGRSDAVSLGPGFVLFARDDGTREAVDLATGARLEHLPLGAAAVATDTAGNAGLVAEGGRAYVSRDRGKTWTDVTERIPLVVSSVQVLGGAVFFRDEKGSGARLDPGGPVLASVPGVEVPALAPADPRWRSAAAPLERAADAGVPFGEHRAIVAEQGSVFTLSLDTGEILDVETGAVPPDMACEATKTTGAVRFLCRGTGAAAVFVRDDESRATKLEHTFPTDGTFFRGAGDALLYNGPCAPRSAPPPKPQAVACSRSKTRGWVELDRSAELSDTPQTDPVRVLAWVPRDEGAWMVLGGKGGGLMDASTGERTSLDDAGVNELGLLFGASGRVVDRFAVASDGAIVGFANDNVGFRVSNKGKTIERSPFRMSSVAPSGAHALARSNAARDSVFLTSDFGWTYTEVAGPPVSGESPRSCSPVGCVFPSAVRIGWELEPPRKEPSPQAGPSPSQPTGGALPELRCSATGPIARKSTGPIEGRPGFGAEVLLDENTFVALFPRSSVLASSHAVEAMNLRAAITGRVPSPAALERPGGVVSESRRIRWIEPFDGKGTVRDSTFRLGEIIDASRSTGGSVPDFSSIDDRGDSVVVASRGDDATVLLGGQAPFVWARGKEKPLVLSPGPDGLDLTLASAVRTGPDALAVLVVASDGVTHVRALAPGRADELFSLPPSAAQELEPQTTDSLAIADDGKLSVLRVLSRGAPTARHPALLLSPGAAPIALAPWSTLEDASSAACGSMQGGVHAVVVSREPWVRLGTFPADGSDRLSLAKVRWSRERVCLDALEVPAVVHDLPEGTQVESYVAARFGKDASAGHVMVAAGAELREPRTCTLAPVSTLSR